ncbi:NADH:ubiquinone oxidoreductase subunit M [compost metagenome]
MLWMFQRVFYGPVTHGENAALPDLRRHEWASAVPLCAMALFMGIFPAVFLQPMEPAVRKVVEQVQFAQPVTVENDDGEKPRVGAQRPAGQSTPDPALVPAAFAR